MTLMGVLADATSALLETTDPGSIGFFFVSVAAVWPVIRVVRRSRRSVGPGADRRRSA